jgi:hypothetical protein
MKTTVHIADALLADIQKIAAKRKSTLKALVDEGLRHVVAKENASKKPFRLKDGSYPPAHLVGEMVKPMDWEDLSAIIYEGRGG